MSNQVINNQVIKALLNCCAIVVLFLLAACGSGVREDGSRPGKDTAGAVELNTTVPPGIMKYKHVFLHTDDSIQQFLGINYTGNNEVEFMLDYRTKNNSCKLSYRGTATNKNAGADPELDEDENGDAYPSDEFLYEKDGYIIAVRIAMKEKDKAIVLITGCNDPCCLERSAVLRIQ
jgi:hypothetical protein